MACVHIRPNVSNRFDHRMISLWGDEWPMDMGERGDIRILEIYVPEIK
jgi:hypothetical protein